MEYVFQLVDGPDFFDEDYYAASLLGSVLGADVGSRIFWELIDTGRADSAAWGPVSYSDAGLFETFLASRPEDVAENLSAIRRVLAEAARDGVREDEVTRARNKALTAMVLSNERPLSRLFRIGSEWLIRGKYFTLQEKLDILRGLTVDDLNAVLKKRSLSNPFTIAVGPLDSFEVN